MGRTLGMGAQLAAPPEPEPLVPPGQDVSELSYLELKKIRQRVAPPKYEVILFANGLQSLAGDFDTNGIEVNGIIINVIAGTLKLWLTADAGSTTIPPYTFTSSPGAPVQLLLTLKDRHFSWTNDAATLASITIQAL
jgi:hypothetical protein